MRKIHKESFLQKVMILITVFLLPTAVAGMDWPEPVQKSQVKGFVGENTDAGVVLLQDYSAYDLKYDAGRDGLFGTLKTLSEFVLTDRASVESNSAVYTYDHPTQKLDSVEVKVFSQDGVRRYKEKDLRWVEWTDRENGVVTLDGRVSRAFIPRLKVGDQIRVTKEYKLKGTFGVGIHQLGNPDVPNLGSTLKVRMPADYQLIWGSQGAAELKESLVYEVENKTGKKIYSWFLDGAGDPKACNTDYPNLDLTLHVTKVGNSGDQGMTVGESWSTVGLAYGRKIENKFEASPEMVALARSLVASADTPTQKIDLIYAEVQKRCRYLGLYEGTGGLIPESAKDVFTLGHGDCKGLATLLISMLRAVGIPACPVLVLSDDSKTINGEIPTLSQFNHFIAWADDGADGVFLDGTVDFFPAGMVPASDRRSEVLLIRQDGAKLVEIPVSASPAGEVNWTITGQLNSEGFLSLHCAYRTDGLRAFWNRSHLTTYSPEKREEAVRSSLETDNHPMSMGQIEIDGLDRRGGSLEMAFQAQSSGPLPKTSTELFLPMAIWDASPRKQGIPACGVQAGLWDEPIRQESWTLDLPEGFSLAEPDSLVAEEGGLRWSYRCWQEGNQLRVEQSFRHFKEQVEAEEMRARNKLIRSIRKKGKGYHRLVRE